MADFKAKGAIASNGSATNGAAVQLGDITFNKYWTITPPALTQEESTALMALPERLQAFLQSDTDNAKLTSFVMAHMNVFSFMSKQGIDLKALETDLDRYRNNPTLLKRAIKFKDADGNIIKGATNRIINKIDIDLPDNSPIAKLLGTLATQLDGKTLDTTQQDQVAELLDVIGLSSKLDRPGWTLKPGASQSEYVASLLRQALNNKIDDELALKHAAQVTDITKDQNGNAVISFGKTQVTLSGKGVSLSDANNKQATAFAVDSLIASNGKDIAFKVTITNKDDVPAFRALCKEMLERGLKLDSETRENYKLVNNNFATARNMAPGITAELINA